VLARGRVFLMHPGKSLGSEGALQPDQGRPQAPMHKRQLALHQAAQSEIGRLFEPLQNGEDLVTARVSPPTASYRLADDRFDQARCATTAGDQHDTVLLDERQGALGIHHASQV